MTVPMLRNSERKAFKHCQQQWWWAYREGLQPKGLPAPPLWFGTGIHLALAAWYCGPGAKRGPHPAETWESYANEELVFIKTMDPSDPQMEVYVNAVDMGRTLMEEYVKHYGRDEHKLIIKPEHTFSLDIPWRNSRQEAYSYDDGDLLTVLKGTFDSVWRHADTGWVILDEHKTARSIRTRHLDLDDQGGTYWTVASLILREQGLLKAKESIKEIEYNFIRKGLPDDRPKDAKGYALNKNGTRSKIQPKPLFERYRVTRTRPEQATQLRRIQDEAVQMRAVRDGLLPLTLRPSFDCAYCPFEEMCKLKEAGGSWKDYKRLQYNVVDPYADHRKSAEE